jgi:formate dehydrogenase gamma subunit
MNFTTISAFGLIAAVALAVLHLIVCRPWRFAPAKSETKALRYGVIERLIHLGGAVGFAIMLVTSFVPVLTGKGLDGWLLMIHVGASPVFFLSVLASLLVWGEDCCFGKADCEWFSKALRDPMGDPGERPATGRFDPLQKAYMWMAGVLCLVLMATVLVSMIRIFPAECQTLLLTIHRLCALTLLMLTVLHTYRTVLGKPGGLSALCTGRVNAEWEKKFHPQASK